MSHALLLSAESGGAHALPELDVGEECAQRAPATQGGHRKYVIAVAGGSAGGKSYVCDQLREGLTGFAHRVQFLPCDAFYRPLTPEDIVKAHAGEFDFDCPAAIDWDMYKEVLRALRAGEDAMVPVYDFASHRRSGETKMSGDCEVIITEGILIFHHPSVCDLFDERVFVECDGDTRLGRRIERDVRERGRKWDDVVCQYQRFVKPSYIRWVEPSKQRADVIIPNQGWTGFNMRAVRLLVSRLEHELRSGVSGQETNCHDVCTPDLLSLPGKALQSGRCTNCSVSMTPPAPASPPAKNTSLASEAIAVSGGPPSSLPMLSSPARGRASSSLSSEQLAADAAYEDTNTAGGAVPKPCKAQSRASKASVDWPK